MRHTDSLTEHENSFFGRTLVAIAIILLALNLRTLVSSVGVLLDSVQNGLGMSPTVAGVLTTLPVICFAVAGVITQTIIRRFGLHATTMVSLASIMIGLLLRVIADNSALFIATSVIALAGAAIGNVALPPLVKYHFPDHIAGISAAYGAAIIGGAAIASATTVPLAHALGGWRQGLAIWAALAIVTIIPWIPQLRNDSRQTVAQASLRVRDMARSPIAWGLALVLGAQSAQAYAQFGWFPAIMHDAGMSVTEAGLLLGLLNGIGVPLTLLLPLLIKFSKESAWLPWIFTGTTISGYVGLLLIPATAPWLWAILLGSGAGAFTWSLTMIGRRSHSAATAGVLSAFVQGVGYPIAGLGPLLTGILHDLTGTWTLPIIMLVILMVAVGIGGNLAARPHTIEEELYNAQDFPQTDEK